MQYFCSELNANVTLYVPPPANSTDDDDSPSDVDEVYYPRGPQFFTYAETFNAPLNMDIAHEEGSADTNFRLRAINNLGNARVSLDSRYAGTFDVNTMFAQADVLTWDGTSFDKQYGPDDDDGDDSDDDDNDDYSSSSSSANDLAVKTDDATPSSSTSSSSPTSGVTKDHKVRLFLPDATSSETSDAADPSGRCLEYDLISSSEIRGWVGVAPRPSRGPRPSGNQSHVEVISSLNGAQLILQP